MTAALAILGSLTLVGAFVGIVRKIDAEFADVDYMPHESKENDR